MNRPSASPEALPALSPLAARLAAAIAGARKGRVEIDVLRDVAQAADLSLVGAPDGRSRLAEALNELAEVGLVALPVSSRAWDSTVLPALPRWVAKQSRPVRAPAPVVPQITWHGALGWAAAGGWSPDEVRFLRAVNDWLIAGGPTRSVPLQERSLQLLGDEKALGQLLRGALFGPGRLTLEQLGAFRSSPPFVYKRTGRGPYALVLENSATYRSVLDALSGRDTPIGLVAFGGGNGFVRSVEFFAELAEDPEAAPILEIRYFGDLDADGLRIPAAASRAAIAADLPPVRPAGWLYRRLLEVGRPASDTPVDAVVAADLAAWLPADLGERAADVLRRGQRLAQEAVGAEILAVDPTWLVLAEPSGRPRPAIARHPRLPAGELALERTDTGEARPVATETDWDAWVSAGRTRNYALGDPILDWLRQFGSGHGFVSDRERPGYDERTDFALFVQRKGVEFETGVLRLLAEKDEIVQIGHGWEDSRSLERAEATVAAMRARAPIIAQAVLRNPANQTYGMADLLVRSDVLARLFPGTLSDDEVHEGAPGLGLDHLHYRVVDIKFHTFALLADGAAAGDTDSLPYLVQVWLYNEALGRIAGSVPPSAYLLGRNWTQGVERGTGCLERLARVDHDRVFPRRDVALADLAAEAVAWMRRLRAEGESWQVLPVPSVLELYAHARNTEDAPWHVAKAEIARALHELTLLPRMNPSRRSVALLGGISGWDHPRANAAALGVSDESGAILCDAVLAANMADRPIVLPDRIAGPDAAWRVATRPEFYVDFETVSSLDDDFAGLPAIGGQALVFQIGCGHFDGDTWRFAQWTVDRLDPAEEGRIIGEWLAYLEATVVATGSRLANARIIHWSAAEPVNLETAYNSARTRHPEAAWPTELPWFDFLTGVVRAEPVTVTGAFNFGLKSIAKAMHTAGVISTTWTDGPTDGLGAMIGAWWCNTEAGRLGVPMGEIDLMREIAVYNGVDVRVMAEVVAWLRQNR
jgi:hypothetical protein